MRPDGKEQPLFTLLNKQTHQIFLHALDQPSNHIGSLALLKHQVKAQFLGEKGLRDGKNTGRPVLFAGLDRGHFHGLGEEVGELLGLIEFEDPFYCVLVGGELEEIYVGLVLGVDRQGQVDLLCRRYHGLECDIGHYDVVQPLSLRGGGLQQQGDEEIDGAGILLALPNLDIIGDKVPHALHGHIDPREILQAILLL